MLSQFASDATHRLSARLNPTEHSQSSVTMADEDVEPRLAESSMSMETDEAGHWDLDHYNQENTPQTSAHELKTSEPDQCASDDAYRASSPESDSTLSFDFECPACAAHKMELANRIMSLVYDRLGAGRILTRRAPRPRLLAELNPTMANVVVRGMDDCIEEVESGGTAIRLLNLDTDSLEDLFLHNSALRQVFWRLLELLERKPELLEWESGDDEDNEAEDRLCFDDEWECIECEECAEY
jgi:hypothetical protein